MIPGLYEPFQKWAKKGSVWLISDPHFDDKDTCIINSNWPTSIEYVTRLNRMITKNDTLICLGDCGKLNWIAMIRAGYKVLIKGNHDDKGNSTYSRMIQHDILDKEHYSKKDALNIMAEKYPGCKLTIAEAYDFHAPFERWNITIDNGLFDEVYDGPLFISDRILLSHEPINGLSFCTNIHGHCHNFHYDYTDIQGGRHLNIAADVVGWQPIELKKLIRAGLISKIPDIHRITIDKASKK